MLRGLFSYITIWSHRRRKASTRGHMTLWEINRVSSGAFTTALGAIFEHSPWVAERASAARPFADIAGLHDAMMAAVRAAPDAMQLALIRAHPELAGKAALRGELTHDSKLEQSRAGLDLCSPDELARLKALNAAYSAKFGFPFILAVKGYDRAGILREFARRIENDRDAEFDAALAQIGRITRSRLDALLVE
jgi:2-oxo-4-hydroxy-4-carboxy-5-ureidoimidazoline decarboxylase